MKIEIIEPTKAIIKEYTKEEIEALAKELTIRYKSIEFQIRRIKNSRWYKNNPEKHEYRIKDLYKKLKKPLLQHDGDNYWIRPGYIPYIESVKNIKVETVFDYPTLKEREFFRDLEFEPYPYQKEAVDRLVKIKHGSLSLPTGSGKSLIILMLAKKIGRKTIVVTPSVSIFNELYDLFSYHFGKSLVGKYGAGKKQLNKEIVIAVAKSLTTIKEGSKDWKILNKFNTLIADEAHTLPSATLEKVTHGVLTKIPYRFFLSATQTRNDGTEKLLYSIIGKQVIDMTIEDAIKGGFLCPLKFFIKNIRSDYHGYINDPLEEKRQHLLYNKNVAEFYAKIANASWNLKKERTLILVDELVQISMLLNLLKVPVVYAHSSKNTEDLKRLGLEKVDTKESVEKFNKGEAAVLIGTSCIATGTNIYPTHNTCNWVGGSSEIVTKQGVIGRSTRKLEKSKYKDFSVPKPFTKIFDVNIVNSRTLQKHLEKRLKWYIETGGKIVFIDKK